MYQICRKPLVPSDLLGLGFLEWILRHIALETLNKQGHKGKNSYREWQEYDSAPSFILTRIHWALLGLLFRNRQERLWVVGRVAGRGWGHTVIYSRSVLSADKDNKPIFRWFIWSLWKSGRGLSGTWTSRNCIFGWRVFSWVLSGRLQESHLDGRYFFCIAPHSEASRKGAAVVPKESASLHSWEGMIWCSWLLLR